MTMLRDCATISGRWITPASEYPSGKHGSAEIVQHHQPAGFYECYGQSPHGRNPGYQYYQFKEAQRITTLEIAGQCWMVDDPPHWWAMQAHAAALGDDVLIVGLGLGLILHMLQMRHPAPDRVTVIERCQDVIDLVWPLIPKRRKWSIIHEDWQNYLPRHVREHDSVLFDLYTSHHGPSLIETASREMVSMRKRFPWIDPQMIRIHGFPQKLLWFLADHYEEQAK